MQKRFHLTVITLIMLLSLLIAACVPTPATEAPPVDKPVTEKSPEPAAPEPAPPVAAEPEKKAGSEVVRVLAVSGPETDSLIASAAAFEKATGITASIEQVSRDLWGERKVRELLQDSGLYDVVMIGGGDDLVWTTQKAHITPLNDYISEEDLAQLMHADYFTKDGELFGVPQYYNFPMLFYRKDMLENPEEQKAFEEKYGYELSVPQNYDQLRDVAEFFHRPPEMSGFCLGGVDWSIFLDFTYFIYGMNSNFGDLEIGELTLNSPEFVRALDAMTRMTAFNPNGWETMNFFDCDAQVQQGKSFMYQNWFYIWPTFYEQMPDKVAMAPVTGDVQPGAHIGAMVGVIPQAAPNPESAGKFLSWMLSAEYQKEMLAATGNLPVRKDLMEDPEVRKAFPGIEMYEQTIPYLTFQHTTWPAELDSGVTEAIWKILKGEMSAQEAADWLQNVKFADRKAIE